MSEHCLFHLTPAPLIHTRRARTHTNTDTHTTLHWMCGSSNSKKHLREVEESIFISRSLYLTDGAPSFINIYTLEFHSWNNAKQHLSSLTAQLVYRITSLPTSRHQCLSLYPNAGSNPLLVNLTLKVSASTSAPLRLVWEEMPTKNSLPVKRMSLPSNVAPPKLPSSAPISTTVSFNSDTTLFTASTCRERTLAMMRLQFQCIFVVKKKKGKFSVQSNISALSEWFRYVLTHNTWFCLIKIPC